MKKNLCIILALLVNIPIAFIISKILRVQNIVIFRSISASNYTITYEIVIWIALCLIEYGIYKYFLYRKLQDEKIVKELNQALKEMKERLKEN